MLKKIILLIVVMIFIITSCSNPVTDLQNTNRQVAEINGFTVLLKEGVTMEALEISEAQNTVRSAAIAARGISSLEETNIQISLKELAAIAESIESENNYIDYMGLPEDNFEIIKEDFIGLTDDEIAEYYDEIYSIYQMQERYQFAQALSQHQSSLSRASIYGSANDLEIALIKSHPENAIGTYYAKEHSINMTDKLYGTGKWDDDDERCNAFKHTFWNVLMARQTPGSKAERIAWAKAMGDAHENNEFTSTNLSRQMDFNNNDVGREIFNVNTVEKRIIFYWMSYPSINQFQAIVKSRIDNAMKVSAIAQIPTNHTTAVFTKGN